MNCDIALTTDILIYDSCGKKVRMCIVCFSCRLLKYLEKIGSIHMLLLWDGHQL